MLKTKLCVIYRVLSILCNKLHVILHYLYVNKSCEVITKFKNHNIDNIHDTDHAITKKCFFFLKGNRTKYDYTFLHSLFIALDSFRLFYCQCGFQDLDFGLKMNL